MAKSSPQFKRKLLSVAILCALPFAVEAKITLDNPLNKHWSCETNDQGQWLCKETETRDTRLFDRQIPRNDKRQQIADALNWVPTNDRNNICGGAYFQTQPKPPATVATIQYNEADGTIGSIITARGDVIVRKGDQTIMADKATVKQNPTTNQVEKIGLIGNVSIDQPGQFAIGDRGKANLAENTAVVYDAYYRLRVNEKMGSASTTSQQTTLITPEEAKSFTGYGHGHADKVEQLSQTEFKLTNATYTTGSPFNNDWHVSASSIDIDKEKDKASLWNTVFHVKDIPVFYTPYFSFPLSSERKTGFLYPQAGHDNAGYYLSTPFYINLAPNYDLTVTPTYYTDSGVMLGGDFRYLTQTNQGELTGQFMPDDRQTGTNRKAFNFTDSGNYGNHFTSYLQYEYIGDPNFYNDFSGGNLNQTTQSLLNRQALFSYNDTHWNASINAQSYNAINSELSLENRPYDTLPQININATYPDIANGVNLKWDNQITNFYKSPLNGQTQVEGQRLYVAPKIEIPLTNTWGYIKPSVGINARAYQLQNTTNSVQNFNNSSATSVLPILNLDAGLYFDRDFQYSGANYQQTLEPRLFYTYIPYQNQQDIPLFDTSLTNFTYQSLFMTNQFIGYDRINNANQASLALETNIIDRDTGTNKLSAGIGQMVYFADRKVNMCQGINSDCQAYQQPYSDAPTSPVVGFASWQFLPDWYLQTGLTYRLQNSQMENQSYSFQYRPDEKHILNFGYQNIQNNYAMLTPQKIQPYTPPPRLSQVTVSGIWKFTEHWALTGLYSYAFNANQATNMFAGVEYNDCSWAIRFLAQRSVDSSSDPNQPSEITGPLNNSFMVQLELKGLGGSSSGSIQERMQMISGYNPMTSGFN